MLGPLMLDLQAYELDAEEQELIQHPLVGGIILFARNYHDRQQLIELIKNIRKIRQELLISVDHEGGRVQRFREGFTRLPALAEFGKLYLQNSQQALQQVFTSAQIMAKELLAVGIDFSIAPVLDIDVGVSQIVGDRSFANNADTVIALANAYVNGMHSLGMAATGKHFPGHGAVAPDSHHELPTDQRDLKNIADTDMVPFIALSEKLNAIMPAHIVFTRVDKYPVNFSTFWLQEVLRKRLRFEGAIISDDLSMQGAAVIGGYLERTEAALTAGCDMATLCNNRAGTIAVINQLKYKPSQKSQQRLMNMKAKIF